MKPTLGLVISQPAMTVIRKILSFVFLSLLPAINLHSEGNENDEVVPENESMASEIYVIPVKGPIAQPALFAIRTGVKEAIENNINHLILNMDTPGGRLDVTLEILEVLDRYPGKTYTFVNTEATSAGAIIASVTDKIYFEPKGTMGSAEAVSGQGEDIQESMKRKISSFLNSKLEAYTEDYPYRSEVIIAMMDPDYEFKIGEEVIKEKGELLNLNAKRAHKEYGEPPQSILGSGVFDDLDALLDSLAKPGERNVTYFEETWSLDLANFLVKLSPVLLGIGILGIYLEIQTPGFGIPGILGAACFLVALFGHQVAGLSGNEAMLIFIFGAVLLFLEIILMPGALILAIPGLLLMFGSLVWGMADVWPENTPDYNWSIAMLEKPFVNVMLGLILGVGLILAFMRFMPRSMVWNRLVISEQISGDARNAETIKEEISLVGCSGVAVTDLYPSGEVEIEGERHQAHLVTGSLKSGQAVRVVARSQFSLEVEAIEEDPA
ncbi:hypothetical protein MLD52_16310 [Puniceicoccaceae bacterium K14]|nr:hypothetical protein [Puniceicoccaceae bacterium K14]